MNDNPYEPPSIPAESSALPVSNFNAFRRATIWYWEIRRVIYNIAVLVSAWFGYAITDTMNWVGDPHESDYKFVIPLFANFTVIANVCYTLCYALEFYCGGDYPTSLWIRFGRVTVFLVGLFAGILLAFGCGSGVANLEWDYRLDQL